jgi:chromosome segregation ATPase
MYGASQATMAGLRRDYKKCTKDLEAAEAELTATKEELTATKDELQATKKKLRTYLDKCIETGSSWEKILTDTTALHAKTESAGKS